MARSRCSTSAWPRRGTGRRIVPGHGELADPGADGNGGGVILGTAAYMSPEQARGRTVDRRADIWAFGVVLYEMLTGRRLFEGDTVSDLLASVLKTDPDWSALPSGTPAPLRRLLGRCLVREPRERLHDMADARLEIEEAIAGGGARRRDRCARAPRGGATTALLSVRGRPALGRGRGVVGLGARPHPSGPVRRFEIPTEDLDVDLAPAVISPDGRRILYVAASRLWVRDLDRVEPRAIATSNSLYSSFWSPDSQQVAYFSRSKLWKVPAQAGRAEGHRERWIQVVLLQPGAAHGSTTGGSSSPQRQAPPSSPSARRVATSPYSTTATRTPRIGFRKPSALPHGGVLMVVDRRPQGSDTIAVSLAGRRHELLRLEREVLDSPVYSPSGHVLYRRRSGTRGSGPSRSPSRRWSGPASHFSSLPIPPGPASPRMARRSSRVSGRAGTSWPGWIARGRWTASSGTLGGAWLRQPRALAGWKADRRHG